MGAAFGFVVRLAVRHWRVAGVLLALAAVAGGGWYIQHLRGDIDQLQTRYAQAMATAQANAQAVGVLREELDKRQQVQQQLQRWQEQSQARYGRLRHDIQQQIQHSSDALRACLRMRVDAGLLERLRDGAAGADGADQPAE